jgi:uncharacterized delta-60 repeat protein
MSTARHSYLAAVQTEPSTAVNRRFDVTALALLTVLAFICSPRQAVAQAGALDATFGTGGVFSAPSSFSTVTSVALQSDGKILAAGMINNFPGVLRLNTNGTPDTSFGAGGAATSTFGTKPSATKRVAVAVQTDGKILMAATDAFADNGGLGFELARFNTNGSPDTTFGNNGTVNTFPFNQNFLGGNVLGPSVMALQPDGRILLAGSGVMVRYETNGQLDSTFGSGGSAVLVSPLVSAMGLQANGQILIASGIPFMGFFTNLASIARYNSNGSLDTHFGSSGQAACLVSGAAVLVQNTGKIVVAGALLNQLETLPALNQTGFGLVRLKRQRGYHVRHTRSRCNRIHPGQHHRHGRCTCRAGQWRYHRGGNGG